MCIKLFCIRVVLEDFFLRFVFLTFVCVFQRKNHFSNNSKTTNSIFLSVCFSLKDINQLVQLGLKQGQTPHFLKKKKGRFCPDSISFLSHIKLLTKTLQALEPFVASIKTVFPPLLQPDHQQQCALPRNSDFLDAKASPLD